MAFHSLTFVIHVMCVITGDSVAANKYHKTLPGPGWYSLILAWCHRCDLNPKVQNTLPPATKNKGNVAQVLGVRCSVLNFSDNSGRALALGHIVGYLVYVIAMPMHAASSTKRCTAATTEAPMRWCPSVDEPIVPSCQTGNVPPCFHAVSRGNYSQPLHLKVRSGFSISLVKQSSFKACGFEIVIDRRLSTGQSLSQSVLWALFYTDPWRVWVMVWWVCHWRQYLWRHGQLCMIIFLQALPHGT